MDKMFKAGAGRRARQGSLLLSIYHSTIMFMYNNISQDELFQTSDT